MLGEACEIVVDVLAPAAGRNPPKQPPRNLRQMVEGFVWGFVCPASVSRADLAAVAS